MMRIAVDFDETLTAGNHSIHNYFEIKPNITTINKVNESYDLGNEIFIYTVRKHIEHDSLIDWLDDNEVKYDHLECGKLMADMYIDNNSRKVSEDWSFNTSKPMTPSGWKPDTVTDVYDGFYLKINITAVMLTWKKIKAWLKNRKGERV